MSSLDQPSGLKQGRLLRRVDRTLVMGVLNVTPDSFYAGSRADGAAAAFSRAREFLEDGADVLDIGGESSRPGAEPVAPAEEMARVLPVIEAVSTLDAVISVDTYRAGTARRAIAAGASVVNDITAFRRDDEMAGVVASHGVSCILMHMRGTPQTMQEDPRYEDVVDEITAFFEERVRYAVGEGVKEEQIWLDPGFGFGKTAAHNLELLRRLSEFKRLGFPILVGTSNKSTIGKVLDLPVEDRLEGTAATVAVAIMNGADAVRVHDVRAMSRVARMTDAIVGRVEP